MEILYRTKSGVIALDGQNWSTLGDCDWNDLLARDDLASWLASTNARKIIDISVDQDNLPPGVLAPIVNQEVWACGVTYFRSRDARMAESKEAGGGSFYDRVYDAPRPEIFFKSTAHRTSGHRQPVRIRGDATWNVPEPELALVVSPSKRIIGYTIGNDMSSRDIEGENPLYLPQAKIYDGCCALGPGILVTDNPLDPATRISLNIERDGEPAFEGDTELSQMKRTPGELVEYLYRDNSFPHGCFVLTGTGVVPPDTFTLKHGDVIRISIDSIGTLINTVSV